MQLRRLAALERQEIHRPLRRADAGDRGVQRDPRLRARQREIVSEELAEIVDKFGDERRTQLIPYEGDMSAEDFIPEEDVVVTITRGGYAKRTEPTSTGRSGAAARACAVRSCARTTSSSTSS